MTADQDVANAGNGGDATGAFVYALVAMLFDSNMFGLSKDYAYPEGANATASRWNQITTLAKVLTRTAKLADKNSYDALDMLRTCTKWVLSQNIHINDDEPNSVNFKAPA